MDMTLEANNAVTAPQDTRIFSHGAGVSAPNAPEERHSPMKRKRNEFMTTDAELKLIAAAATMGLKSIPNAGWIEDAGSGWDT